ncbi:MAG TPA: hypothetical protein ENL19_01170, partial [candidate division WOR-3 bacterium]|nr:hypothetical protein [candidate division WOR-3 bacterium]
MILILIFLSTMDTTQVNLKIAETDSIYEISYKDSTLLYKAKAIMDTLLETGIKKDEVLWRLSFFCYEIGSTKKDKHEKMEWYEKGKEYGKEAIEANPNNPQAHYWYAANMGSIGKLQGVVHSLFMVGDLKKEANRVLELNPKHAGAHIILGEIYKSLPGFAGGNKNKAAEEFQKAIENDSLYTASYTRLADTYIGMKKYREARKILNKMLALK